MELKAPLFPESISEGELVQWYKEEGDYVERDELVADVETEKTTMEISSPVAGVLSSKVKNVGDLVESEDVLGVVDESAAKPATPSSVSSPSQVESVDGDVSASPSARKLAAEHGINLNDVSGTGKNGLITKNDVSTFLRSREEAESAGVPESTGDVQVQDEPETLVGSTIVAGNTDRTERRAPMTRLRATIARRLVEVQQTSAMLTTFNEANMAPIMRMREQYQEEFTRRHNGTRLGFMSFFVRASVEALRRFPLVNALIDGNEIVYHGYFDIGVAVSTERGLVVPVVRDADALGMAQIENQIIEYSTKARENRLAIEDMQGGTFTISNGGVFGSLLSTPILNPPQTAILGMHKIQERPVVEDGQIVARPMMYLALSYDHRLIDGQEAVQFLVTIKGLLEDPARILLEL